MDRIYEVSNPEVVLKQLKKYYGNEIDLYLSSSKNKKYMVYNEEGKKIHFGDLRFSDYTKTKNIGNSYSRNSYYNKVIGSSEFVLQQNLW